MNFPDRIDFNGIKEGALARSRSLLPQLVPGGRFEHEEYVALNPSRADKNLGSFKINARTGLWQDFAIGAKGNDIISWYAHSYGLDQSEAARRIAEKLGTSSHKGDSSEEQTTKPPTKIYSYGDEGPPVGSDEIRRHYHPKRGEPKLKVKIKKSDGAWTTCYRAFENNTPIGWQYKKPANFRTTLYFGAVRDPNKIFWTEGEKDADTLDGHKLSVFTFGGAGDGLPKDAGRYLKLLGDRLLIIATDNDAPGRAHAEKKAQLAQAVGVKKIRIFDPEVVWSDCPEGGDVTDWFENGGGTREKLIEIVHALPDWQPSAGGTASEGFDSFDTIENPRGTGEPDIGTWDDPDFSILDDRRGALPEFPIDVFSPKCQAWLKPAAAGAGATVDHVAVPLLGAISSLIGTSRQVQATRSWRTPLTTWTAVIGFSGTNKTPGLDVIRNALSFVEGAPDYQKKIDTLRRAHEKLAELAKAASKQWKQSVQEAVEANQPAPDKPAAADDPGEFIAPRLFVSNVTIERVPAMLRARRRGILGIYDELSGLFLNMSRYSNGQDNEFWLESWNGKRYVIERVGRPAEVVPHLLIGVTGGMQPDKLARCFKGDQDGMYARFCFSWPNEPQYRPLSDEVQEVEPEIVNALTRIINIQAETDGVFAPRAIPLTPEARDEFEQFLHFAHQERQALEGRERDWWAKGSAHVLRIAGTLAYLDWAMEGGGDEPSNIEAQYVLGAIRLVRDYFWPHARAALRQIGLSERHSNARKVLRWIRARGKTTVGVLDIRRDALGQSLDAEQTRELLGGIASSGWLRKTTKTTDGRPAHRWLVNPILFVGAGSAESPMTYSAPTPKPGLPALPALPATHGAAATADAVSDKRTNRAAETPPANSSEPIPAISETGPKSAPNDGEATWTV